MNHILINDALILPMTCAGAERYFNGSIGISGSGIAFVSADPADAERFRREHAGNLREIDGRGRLAMPGLVNTHNHISMTLLRGYADDLPLMTWLGDHVWPFEGKMTRDDVRLGAELGMAEMLLGGTTTSADMYWMDEAVAEAAEKAGIRAVIATSAVDARVKDFDTDFAILSERYGNGQNPRITLAVAPHAVYTCSPDTLIHMKKVAERHDIGITIHVSETQDEQRIVRERYGKTPIELLDGLGMLTPKTLAVHCVYVSDSDIDLMARRGVSVAHNPQSNLKLASGIAPVAKMVAAGINVTIGTDGPSSNNDLDMWEELRTAAILQKGATLDPCVLPAYDVLRMATSGGARALGLGDLVGELRPGMAADIILIDIEQPHFYPRTDMVANLVYCGKSGDVETVIVNGRVVVDNRHLVSLDSPSLCRQVQERFTEIKKRL